MNIICFARVLVHSGPRRIRKTHEASTKYLPGQRTARDNVSVTHTRVIWNKFKPVVGKEATGPYYAGYLANNGPFKIIGDAHL